MNPSASQISGMSVGDMATLIQQQQEACPTELAGKPLPNGLLLKEDLSVDGSSGGELRGVDKMLQRLQVLGTLILKAEH